MTDATVYAENQWLDAWFANAAYDGPIDGPEVALWTTNPADDPVFSNEVAGNQYTRQTTVSADWTQSSAGTPTTYTTVNEIDFGVLDDSVQTTVEGVVFIRTDLGSDEALFAKGDVSEVVDANDELRIAAGDATISVD